MTYCTSEQKPRDSVYDENRWHFIFKVQMQDWDAPKDYIRVTCKEDQFDNSGKARDYGDLRCSDLMAKHLNSTFTYSIERW